MERLKEIKNFCSTLQIQLASTQTEVEALKCEKQKLMDERAEEVNRMQKALDNAQQDKIDLDKKWKKEFEQLRSNNSEREEHLLEDCEWQVRNMQKLSKEKLDIAEKAKNEAIERANEMEKEAQERFNEV